MWNPRHYVFLLFLLSSSALASWVAAQRSSSQWQTLSGDAPIVIARGGLSGLLPDSSSNAYALAAAVSLPNNSASWCDVQLTKDGAGICFPDINLGNSSNVQYVYNNRVSTYDVNGVPTTGYFSIDFTSKELRNENVSLTQGIYSRPFQFDGGSPILTVDEVVSLQARPPLMWLNVQHDGFYSQHNLNMSSFVISVSRRVVLSYISSPEVNFLVNIGSSVRPSSKLIFRFLGPDVNEPTTNQTYGSLRKNLTFIKTFASGILVPKSYIWPVDSNMYLLPCTSLVSDAHNEGLEVYASDFANDQLFAYDYNYDPVSEVLSYIDNGNFSVDGVLTDFPLTSSASIDCFSHMDKNETNKVKFQIITSEGSSGEYPGCTDRAYIQAIADGADIIDCPVQMSKDGIPFCLGSINLIERTTVAQTTLINFTMSIPELSVQGGICAFNLTWSQIQSLTPSIYNPYTSYAMYRNPRNKNAGSLVSLSQFLDIARNASSVSGVLISIENASFLAENVGLGVVDVVVDALSRSGYDSLSGKKVYIQSGESAVLKKLGKSSNYELFYIVGETVSDVTYTTVSNIKEFATAVVITKNSIFSATSAFMMNLTDVFQKFQDVGVPTYVRLFNNEFVSQAWDFQSDPFLEVNTYTSQLGVVGIVTGFPATSSRFRKNRCLMYKEKPGYMLPVPPGGLFQVMSVLPPTEAPNPILDDQDVAGDSLPPVGSQTSGNATTVSGPSQTNEQAPYPKNLKGLDEKKLIIILVPSTAIILVSAICLVLRKQRGRNDYIRKLLNLSPASVAIYQGSSGTKDVDENKDLSVYDLQTIVSATSSFAPANKLGEGGFGSVHKGCLRNGREIAVKRLSKSSGQGIEEFKNEVTLIARLQHRNLVRLLGYCIQEEEKMLVYEYLPNKALDNYIFDKVKAAFLDWRRRFEIIIGIARGIVYLHHDSRLKIIHRDLKSSNVLLDANMEPKISDFGMARMFGADQMEARTHKVVGTYGYMSPEYAMEGLFSEKSDVFSYGVLLLEIISGRKNNSYFNENTLTLIGYVWELWKEGKTRGIVDPAMGELCDDNHDEVGRCILIGLLCVQEHAIDRPTMSKVLSMLCNETSVTSVSPKKPAFVFGTTNHPGNTPPGSSFAVEASTDDAPITVLEAR